MYKIEYARRVEDSLEKFPKKDKKSILDKIEDLKKDPRPIGVEPLHGEWSDYYRVRVGKYRIIYAVQDEKLIVYVVKVAKRGEVYRTS